jgi:hypothetical protein
MLTTQVLRLTAQTAAGVAAALALGAEVLLRGGVTAATHEPEALRAVQAEAREAPVFQSVVKSCRSALLGQLGGATDDVERVAQALREVRCTHRVTSTEDDLRGR